MNVSYSFFSQRKEISFILNPIPQDRIGKWVADNGTKKRNSTSLDFFNRPTDQVDRQQKCPSRFPVVDRSIQAHCHRH
ncbi:Hypothetical protein Minf_0653 [Methylacidiphilum infernorum V4]|uniref:Uncharacterized protein n=1 Tax=Methylacidiphilum infernorum (isolate V4) TaxID=481448 RepID=B3E047_METI4|nr:Hypothetical protein Minf_0653 [Methylacidiphilum infernorum V4]